MVSVWKATITALALLALGGCGGQAGKPASGGMAARADAPLPFGTNAIGEECRAIPAAGDGGTRPFGLFCGAWEQASGSIAVTGLYDLLPDEPSARLRQLAVEGGRTGWAGSLAQRANCQPAQPIALADGSSALLANCQLREGGWPWVGITLARGKQLYQADGIPAVADLLLGMADRLEGKGGEAPTARMQDIQAALRAALGDDALRFGRGDLNDFERLSELGRLSNSVEDYAAAEEAYRRALAIQTRALGDDSPGAGDTLMALALEVSNQGRGEEADGLFRRADRLLQQSFDKAARARLASYMAFHAANNGEEKRALSLSRDASATRRALVDDLEDAAGGGANRAVLGSLAAARGDLIHSLLLEATVSLRLKQYGLAEAAAAEADRLYQRTRGLPPWWNARILGIHGLALAGRGDVAGGAALLSKAVASNRQLFGQGWPVASAMLELGRVYAQAGQDAAAASIYREGLAMVRDLPGGAPLPLDRIMPYLAVLDRMAAADPAARPALNAEMFLAVQQVREGVVGQTITRAATRFATADPTVADLVRQQQDAVRERDRLRIEAAAETAKPDSQRDRAREATLLKQLETAATSAQALERQLQAAFPNYARLSRAAPVAPADLSALLRADEAVIYHVFGSEGGFGFVVRRDGVTAFPVSLSRAALEERVASLRRGLTPRAGALPPFDLALSHDLYRRLLGPADAALQGARSLVFVPTAALLSLPPALLVSAPGDAGDYAGAAWLIRGRSVSVVPSIPALVALERLAARPAAPKPFIGFAAPPFQGTKGGNGMAALAQSCRTDAVMDPALLRALTPLPETADEVRQVGGKLGAVPADILTGAAVTKAAVRDRGLGDYRVIYFATHGLLPGELRCQTQPGLALAPPASRPASAADDGLLTASDIALLRLKADLVVLSACNTAGGDARLGGEALSGLAESFFFAGARSLLVTHWQVPSLPTVRLMTGLFDRAAAQGDLAGALAAAQRAMVAQPASAHPFNWAAFTLVGAAGPAQAAGE
ncbi:CHAT domain-containing protein [Niveispirillum sp. BGYR6]|uniref:CHAT domain-containing protein n=1 Tax=Niveispirillum sp. BGYR6 TaxID=2971249 RepID=UPI0022B9BA47|nr:CHAT domain-containing protein [Niveispirillum sp. BGYR6]MDG5496686.1 CHAT domain-containing protein [Niveispirillum sp. BGYR6]